MIRRRSIVTSTIAVLVAAVALAGCANPPRPQPSATALPGGIQAELVQLRSDVADRQAEVRIHNTDDEPLTIGTVRVDDPRFLGHAVRAVRRQTIIAPGDTVDIRVQLPPMNCSADPGSLPTPSPGPSSAESSPQSELTPAATPTPESSTGFATPGATPRPSGSATPTAPEQSGGLPAATTTRATVNYQFGASIAIAVAQLSEPIPFLADMYERECLDERLSKVAAVTLGAFTPSAPGQPADLAVVVAPVSAEVAAAEQEPATGASPSATPTASADAAAPATGVTAAPTTPTVATIAGFHQTNLLSFVAADGSRPAVYGVAASFVAGQAPQVLHLPLVPGRCDAHVIMEDKRGTVFDVDVQVGAQKGQIQLAATPEQRGQILSWVSSWCGIG